MLLKTIASITKQLNMAPGGEFRVAFIEVINKNGYNHNMATILILINLLNIHLVKQSQMRQ